MILDPTQVPSGPTEPRTIDVDLPRSYTRNKMLATGTEKTNQIIGGAQAQRAPLPAGLESIWQTTNHRRRDHSSASSTAGLPSAHGAEPGRDG